MYACRYAKQDALYVTVWRGASNTDEDWEGAASDIRAVGQDGARHPAGVTVLVDVGAENPSPGSLQRKRMGQAIATAFATVKLCVAVVTPSACIRGVITAIEWILPKHPMRIVASHGTLDLALAWLETQRPGIGARALELHREAARDAAKVLMGGAPCTSLRP